MTALRLTDTENNMAREDRILRPDQELPRKDYAEKLLTELGYDVIWQNENQRFEFTFKGERVWLYPYTGWHTGKTIKDGRGISNLLKQIK